jgi:hypothetical protein
LRGALWLDWEGRAGLHVQSVACVVSCTCSTPPLLAIPTCAFSTCAHTADAPVCHAVRAAQAEELRRQLAEREGELAELGEGLGGLERENANLEAQVRPQSSCLHHAPAAPGGAAALQRPAQACQC